jgi:hypothetical protein
MTFESLKTDLVNLNEFENGIRSVEMIMRMHACDSDEKENEMTLHA